MLLQMAVSFCQSILDGGAATTESSKAVLGQSLFDGEFLPSDCFDHEFLPSDLVMFDLDQLVEAFLIVSFFC